MKLLRIVDNAGQFLGQGGDYLMIDKITKDDLLRMVGQVLEDESADFDEYDGEVVKNQAHQVIYKSVSQKLTDLRKRRTEFVDESARLFLDEYEKYRE